MENNLNVMNINHACICHARTSCFPGLYWENFKFLRKWYLKNENPFTDYELNATGNMTFHQKQLEYIFIIITCKSCPITPPVCAKKKPLLRSISWALMTSTCLQAIIFVTSEKKFPTLLSVV